MTDVKSWPRIMPDSIVAADADPGMVHITVSQWPATADVSLRHEILHPGYHKFQIVGGYLDGGTITQVLVPAGESATSVTTTVDLDLGSLWWLGVNESLVRERIGDAMTRFAEAAG